MFLLSAVLLVTTSASALGTNHLLQPASNFAWSSSTVIDQAAPPPGIDELLAKAERILALAQESKVTVRITEANRAVDGLKALRDGKTGIRNPGSVGAVNRGPGPEFGLAMSRIATQAVTSKIQPVLDIINEMGGHSLMAVLDDWAKANAAFETARNASASNTSSLEQAAENRRTGMMAVFDQLARDPAGYRASTARRDASRARGAVPAPAPTPSAQPVPAAPAAPVGAISLDQLSAQFPANAKEARNALTDIEKELAALKMLSADKNGDSISNALAGKLVILVNESAASLGQEIEAYKDTDRAIMVKHFPCVAAINGAANSLALAYKDLVILGPGLGTYGSATNLRTHLRLAIDGDPAKKTLGLVDLVSCDLDFAQTGSGASLKPQLLASVRASER